MIELDAACVVVPTAEDRATILQPTTLSIAEHRISIIGGNGSGKSTLARLLNGLIEPSTGSVRVRAGHLGHHAKADTAEGAAHTGIMRAGETVATPPAAASAQPDAPWLDTTRQGPAVRRRVGFVFTDPGAQLVMPTVVEDVMLSLRHLHKRKPERRAAAMQVLERFGLAPLADRSVHSLSGGQRQLLAIATVLATEPAILVADEPTTLLDLRNSLRVHELLMGLPQQVIVVTHDLELAARADRTLVVDDARIVFDGPPAEAIAFYRRLVMESGEEDRGTSATPDPICAEHAKRTDRTDHTDHTYLPGQASGQTPEQAGPV